ncbi:MAG: galactokinase [Actinomycetota bacterium]
MTHTFAAPGRVNLMGEHTDYAGGLVLPAAVDRCVRVSGRPGGERVRLTSDGWPGVVDVAADGRDRNGGTGWGRYVAAVVAELADLGRPPVGFEGWVASDLPAGAGLGSSAALEVAVAVALCHAGDFNPDPLELAQAAQRAEHSAMGVPCGIMDQAISLLARADHALLLNCRTLERDYVPLPGDLAMVVFDSGVERSLEDTRYARRRSELEAGMDARVRHFTSENQRVQETVAILTATTIDTNALGPLFAASHASLRDDFEVSTDELDLLVELARQAGAVAARMTGAGFGGSIVALTDAAHANVIAAEVVGAYRTAGHEGRALVCRSADGARFRS